MYTRTEAQCRCCGLVAGLDSLLHFPQMPQNQIKVRKGRAWNRLLVLTGDLEQPPDALHVLGRQRQVPA
jgi:hypothetical protein